MRTSAGTLIGLGAALLAASAFAQDANLVSSGAVIAAERTDPAGERLRVINNSERERVGATDVGGPQSIGDGPVGGIDVGLDLPRGRLAAGPSGDPESQSIGGTPIQGTPIILDGDPSDLRAMTDARGQIALEAPGGTHGLLLPAVQAAREAARRSSRGSPPPGGVVARVEVGRSVLTSAPLMFDSRDPGQFLGPDGRRMVINVPREGARVRVTLVPCCWAANARGPTDAAPIAGANAAPALRENLTPTNGVGGTGGGRFSQRVINNSEVDTAGEGAGSPQALSPYAGIDIMFGSGRLSRVVGATGPDGRFSGRVNVEPGEYTITPACPPRAACPPLQLASAVVDGRTLNADARGRFVFVVRPGVRSVAVSVRLVQTTNSRR